MTVTELRKRDSHIWVRDPHDWYVEPQWASERLFAVEQFDGGIFDPACGMGRIVNSAWKAGLSAEGSDIVDRGAAKCHIRDFFEIGALRPNIVSNPPFKVAEKFVTHALQLAERKVAMLLPVAWIQGDKRSRWLACTPLLRVLFICPRPSMPPGAVILAGERVGQGTQDYAWYIWLRGFDGTPTIGWLRRDA